MKDDVFQQEVENNYKLERVYYKEDLFLIGDLNIIKIRFFKKQNKTPRHLIISSISSLTYKLKNTVNPMRLARYFSFSLKFFKCISYTSNEYEKATIRRYTLKFVYKLLRVLKLYKLAHNFRFYKLSEREFQSLLVYEGNFLERFVRKRQYLIVTDNLKNQSISEIVNDLKEKNLDLIWQMCGEPTQKQKLSKIDRWLDLDFWNNGNSHFFGNIMFEFRKGAVAYENLDFDIDSDHESPPFLSMSYFGNMEPMSEQEILELFESSPIGLRGHHVTSGRHRVFAMVGRLIKGKNYIPFMVDRLK